MGEEQDQAISSVTQIEVPPVGVDKYDLLVIIQDYKHEVSFEIEDRRETDSGLYPLGLRISVLDLQNTPGSPDHWTVTYETGPIPETYTQVVHVYGPQALKGCTDLEGREYKRGKLGHGDDLLEFMISVNITQREIATVQSNLRTVEGLWLSQYTKFGDTYMSAGSVMAALSPIFIRVPDEAPGEA